MRGRDEETSKSSQSSGLRKGNRSGSAGTRLWIDLDNSPHVPLFAPLIRHLRSEMGWEVFVTARDFAQTLDLVQQLGVDAHPVGVHAGKSKIRKIANLPVRAAQLIRAVRGFHPDIALSHGSRTQALASRLLGVPQVVMFDYEWTELRILSSLATYLVCPQPLTRERLAEVGVPLKKVSWYNGFKEELYLHEFQPDPGFRASIGVEADARLITIRPPGIIGNYHDPRSEAICAEIMRRAADDPENHLVILPKTRLEQEFVREVLPEQPRARIMIPDKALPGLQLLHASDLAISGGGTMNRESALLGVRTYSIFTGRRALIDEELERRGLLQFVSRPEEIDAIDLKGRRDMAAREERLGREGSEKSSSKRELLYDLSDMIATFVAVHRKPL